MDNDIPRWMWIVPSIIALLCFLIGSIQLVGAVNIETANYKIETIPEIATIQFGGFHYKIDYTKFLSNYTGDMALCFDTKIRNPYALYNGNIDVTSLFKYKRYEMVKGDCYYVENIFWNINETKTLDIWFLPENSSSSPKWDTYFGDVSLNRIDLMLDPLFNTSAYRIGNIDNGASYFWSNNLVANPDILSYVNVTLYNSNVSTASQFYHYSVASVSGGQASWKLIYNRSNSQFNYSVDVYKMHGSYPSATFNCSIRTRYVYTNGSVNLYEANNNCWSGNTATLSTSSNPSLNLSNTEFYTLDTNFGADTYNITSDLQGYSYPNGILFSNNISLPMLVNSYNINTTYTGGGMINLTFDSINWFYQNLSNTNIITINDSITDNSGLQYKLYLLNSATTINNLTINFNGLINRVNITIYDELTQALITQNVSATLTDLVNPNIVQNSTLSGNIMFYNLNNDLYEIKLTSQNYSERRYYINVTTATSSSLNAYLLPLTSSSNFSIYVQSQATQGVLSNALFIVQKNINNSYVTVAERYTDVNGFANIYLQEGQDYFICISAIGYDLKCFNFQFFLINNPYTFRLTGSIASIYDSVDNHVFYYYLPSNSSFVTGLMPIIWSVVSPEGFIDNISVLLPNGSIDFISGSPSGGMISDVYNFSSAGNYNIVYMASINGFPDIFLNVTYLVYDSTFFNVSQPSLTAGLDRFRLNNSSIWTVLFAIFIIIILVVTIVQLSGSPTAGNIAAILGIIAFTATGFFNPLLGVIFAIIGLGSFFVNRQGGY